MKIVLCHLLLVYALGALPAASASAETQGSLVGDRSGPRTIAILKSDLPESDPATAEHLKISLEAAGFSVASLTAEEAGDTAILSADRFMLFVVPNGRFYPADGLPSLTDYLKSGGHLMIMGGPAFTNLTCRFNDRWFDRDGIRRTLQDIEPQRIVLPCDNSDELIGWYRATNDPRSTGTLRIISDPSASAGRCLAIHTAELTGWDTWYSPAIDELFAPGHSLLYLRARGGPDTPQMTIEIRETDGSRWFAVVELTAAWQKHVLQPGDFKYWPDSPTRNRGTSGDRMNPQNAAVISFGLAQSHTSAVKPGSHTFFVDQVGTAADPFPADVRERTETAPPLIETISPAYKVYELTNIAAVRAASEQRIIPEPIDVAPPSSATSPHVRFAGRGYTDRAKWRFIPLLEAFDEDNHKLGVPFSLLISHTDEFKASVTANLGISGASIQDPSLTAAIVSAVDRIQHGLFLFNAGSQRFAYWPGQKVVLGCRVINTSHLARTAQIRITVLQTDSAETVFTRTVRLDTAPHAVAEFACDWQPPSSPARYIVCTELLNEGQVRDAIRHELTVLPEPRPARDDFVQVRNGDFYVKGRKWYPVGVNYWPMYVAGLEAGDYWLHWLAPGAYDPHEVERDLALMRQMGINMVSIQTGKPDHLPNLIDFLHRCGRHDIRVNAFLENASPLGFHEQRVRDYIRTGRLDENPVIFAWDTIWEPGNYVFSESWRPRWDTDWRRWIVERYGSIENAEQDWAFAAPRTDGRIVSPSDTQLREDGPWRVMVAAYRRFMDNLMSRKWNDATRRLREIVPNHLISFRQGNTLPHDFTFTATAKHIDFICPEGYSIPNTEDGYHAATFITRYVRFTTGGKPIIWSEFGKSVWSPNAMRPDPRAVAEQGLYHDLFYRVVLAAGAQGTAPWWWPGGYRVDEKSDYGIMNPDGTPRPAAQILAEYAPKIKAPRDYPAGTLPMTIDRDAHPGGYWYLAFNTGKDACVAASALGANITIRTAGTGTTSVDTPLVAVGNVPYNGTNPPKYLNAEFNWFRVQDAAGRWIDIRNGDTVTFAAGRPILAEASVGNLQEAICLTPESASGRDGAVYLASTANSQLEFREPIGLDTSYLHDADFSHFTIGTISEETAVEIQMVAAGRAAFGEKIAFTLRPQP